MYNWVTSLYRRDWHSTVNQLYLNQKKKRWAYFLVFSSCLFPANLNCMRVGSLSLVELSISSTYEQCSVNISWTIRKTLHITGNIQCRNVLCSKWHFACYYLGCRIYIFFILNSNVKRTQIHRFILKSERLSHIINSTAFAMLGVNFWGFSSGIKSSF